VKTVNDAYTVHLEARAPGCTSAIGDDKAGDRLMDYLADWGGVVSGATEGDTSWSATVSVDAEDATAALLVASDLVREMADKAGLPPWPIVRAEAMTAAIADDELLRPVLPDLVSAPEVADILGVSPQRVHELASVPTVRFPEPAYVLRAGKLWLRPAIESFNAQWQRRPGRPRKVAAS
jgi:hypothetical protein